MLLNLRYAHPFRCVSRLFAAPQEPLNRVRFFAPILLNIIIDFINYKFNIMEESVKKSPYNIREKKEKNAAYRSLIRAELADELYDKILNIIVIQKKYRDPNYSAKDLAKELKTNTRYLSAVVNSRFGMNYSCLVNEYRIKDAQHMLSDKRYADMNIEEIGATVGFANRQSFYAAFYKNLKETPAGYRKRKRDK